ncbi:MAG: hypothetical protein AAF846_08900 [Chloroflexota bacterium]
MTTINISDPLMQMIFSAVEEGLAVLKAEQNVVPFLLLLTKEGVVMRRFTDTKLTQAIQRAKTAIEEADDDTLGYALVYDGQIEIASQDSDALMVEAGERGKDHGWRFVQRYKAKMDTQQAEAIGDVAYLGEYDNYIS